MSNQIRNFSDILQKSLRVTSRATTPVLRSTTCLIHTTAIQQFQLTDSLYGEPTKAKKRVDPQVLAARENRKKKRIEKAIKSMEKLGRKMKPIEESEADRIILKEAEQRNRNVKSLNKEEEDEEFFLKKEWANYMAQQHNIQMEQLKKAIRSQEIALKELKKDDIDLYNKAIQLDSKLLPFTREGPVNTPPNSIYEAPEGDYNDVTYLYDRRL